MRWNDLLGGRASTRGGQKREVTREEGTYPHSKSPAEIRERDPGAGIS